MVENWKPIAGYEARYEISDLGRIRAKSFPQRYLLRTGAEAFRNTKVRLLAQQEINSGYLIAHLHLNNKRKAFLVHRLVAEAFVGAPSGEVNHKDGNKKNNLAVNLEWLSSKENHLHAVSIGLNPSAIPVICPLTLVRYDSIAQAAKRSRKSPKTVRAIFARAI